MPFIKNFFLVFSLVFMAAVLVFVFTETAFLISFLNPDFYIDAFKKNDFYEKLSDSILEHLETENRIQIPDNTAGLIKESLISLIENLAETEFKNIIKEMRDYFFYLKETFEISINLNIFREDLQEILSDTRLEDNELYSLISGIPDEIVFSNYFPAKDLQKGFNDYKFIFYIPFIFIIFELIFFFLLTGIEDGFIWFCAGFIGAGLLLPFAIIFNYREISSFINETALSMSANDDLLYELFNNLGLSFMDTIRNTGLIFAVLGAAVLIFMKIKKEKDNIDITENTQNPKS
jgi:hypothetical protein